MTYESVWVEPWSGFWLLWTLVPVILGLAIGLIRPVRVFWIVLGLFAGFLVAMAVLIGAHVHDHTSRVEVLVDLGYTDVELKGREFTAADKLGDHAAGVFAHIEGNTWAIIRTYPVIVESLDSPVILD